MFNPISAGVLENQDMLGGGQFEVKFNPPPSRNRVKVLEKKNNIKLKRNNK